MNRFKKASKLVREARESVGMTQKDIKEKVGFQTNQMISNIENGRCPIPPTCLKKYAKTLKVPLSKIQAAMAEDYLTNLRAASK